MIGQSDYRRELLRRRERAAVLAKVAWTLAGLAALAAAWAMVAGCGLTGG